jgi:RNA polymerase sigma-70 factor, ECF subfamily
MGARERSHPELRRAQFEAAALPFMGSVYRAALYLTRRPEDAEDLAQDTYLRAYRSFEDFTPGTNCKAWLLTILHSIFVNKARKAQREPRGRTIEELEQRYHRSLQTPAQPEFPPATGEGPAETGVSQRLAEVLRELPEAFRSVVLLVDVEELSYEETAAALGCPVGTVRSRLFRARRLLSAALRAYAEETGYLKDAKKKE